MENEVKFVDGLFVSRRETAPDFVNSSLSFNVVKFTDWMNDNANANGYVNVDVLTSKSGKLYAKLNDFTPKEKDAFTKKEDGSIGTHNPLDEMRSAEISPENIQF